MDSSVGTDANQLVDRFLKAYNTIDGHLRDTLRVQDESMAFREVARRYLDEHPRWKRCHDQLVPLAKLRNILVHEHRQDSSPPAIPTAQAVSTIERIARDLMNPERAIPCFSREVSRLQLDESLAIAVKLMREKDYSQCPVYADGEFKGVLTERGLARWLTRRVESCSLVDLEDDRVEDALGLEEKRDYFDFAPRNHPVWQVAEMFATNPQLEVVLITEDGCQDGELLGIATVWDIARLKTATQPACTEGAETASDVSTAVPLEECAFPGAG